MENRKLSSREFTPYTFGDISEARRQAVANQLNRLLADEHVLYAKTRNAHWNVEGAGFPGKHDFFTSLYKQLETSIDEIAESIGMLGYYAPATMAEFLKLTHLTGRRNANDTTAYISELLADHENIILHLRGLIITCIGEHKDAATGDFMARLMEEHEKIAWVLRSHLR